MEAFKTHRGLVIPFNRANIDTDVMLPKQYLKSIKKTGYGDWLFDGLRYLDEGDINTDTSTRTINPDFVLNVPRYKGGSILVAGDNFGCGSSREHAPWAIRDFGIKVVIAPSFADIFYNNCFKNGILPIVLDEKNIQELAEYSKREVDIEIKIETQEILYGNKTVKFNLDSFKKKCLMEGTDDIALSLEKSTSIQNYENKIKDNKPWLTNND